MNIKYLYCKYNNLKKFIHKGAGLRFTDIHYFKNLENKKIRDKEDSKNFFYEPSSIGSVQFGNITIHPKDIVADVVISKPVRRSHVLCLSKSEYKKELYDKFNADICIKLDVDLLLQILNDFFQTFFKKYDIKIIHKEIEYYGKNIIPSINPMDLVFKKPDFFKIENEYRIAVFYPFDSDTIIHFNDKRLKIFDIKDKDGINYFELGIKDEIGMKRIILEIKHKDGTLIKS